MIIDADNLKSLEFAIVENVQRKDLNPIEEAEGYNKLINEFNYDQEKVSKFIGKSRSYIANSLRLLSLPKEVIYLIEQGNLTQGHAKILVGIENSIFLAKKIVNKKLSVRQAESLVRILRSGNKIKATTKDPNIKNIEDNLEEKIGIKTVIKNKKNHSGQLTFEYKNSDQLNRLISVIKANY